MTDPTPSQIRRILRHELEAIQGKWLWILILGIALVVLGTAAIGQAAVATFLAVAFLGWLLVFAGAVNGVGAFWSRDWSGFFAHLIGGILYFACGLLMLVSPLAAAEGVTLLIAGILIGGGLFRIAAAVFNRFYGWGWVLAHGAVALLLGLVIAEKWPVSGLWVIGTFVGIELIFSGWNWIFLAILLHKHSKKLH